MSQPFHIGLQRIVPTGSHLRTLHGGHENRPKVILLEELLLLVCKVPGVVIRIGIGSPSKPIRTSGNRLMAAVEHKAGNFLHRQLCSQVLRPLQRTQAPVFIRVQNTVPVQILKRIAAVFQKTGSLTKAQRGTAPLLHQEITICLHLLPSGPARHAAHRRRQQNCRFSITHCLTKF